MGLIRRPNQKIETYLGFPLAPREAEKEGQRGIAMVTAILITSLMFVFLTDMVVNSAVDIEMAVANRNQIKAEYLAKSGFNLAQFLISADLGIDLSMYQTANKVPSDGTGDIWGMVNNLPIGGSMSKLLLESDTVKLSKVSDADVFSVLDGFEGSFYINVTDEQSKININFCSKGHGIQCMAMIEALLSCPAEREFLQRKNLTPEEVVAAIRDWVDTDPSAEKGANYNTESDPYFDREPKVSPKNAPFDSLDELKLVAGWDDEIHRVFSPYLTVYPMQTERESDPRININSISPGFVFCLLKQKNQECRERAVLALNPAEEADRLPDVSGLSGLQSRLGGVFCSAKKDDSEKFTYRSDVFNVKVTGEVGDHQTIIQTVVKRLLPDEIDKRNEFKATYKYLHWKML